MNYIASWFVPRKNQGLTLLAMCTYCRCVEEDKKREETWQDHPPLSGVTTCRVQTLISLSQRMFRIHKCFWLNILAELCYHFNFPQSLVDCFSSLSCLLIHRKHIFLQQVTKSESKHYTFTRANLNFMVW